jgi:arsenate reductase
MTENRMSKVTIYHNPGCSKSRQTLALLTKRNIEPEIVLYLEDPPTTSELTTIIEQLGIPPRELLRTGESEYADKGLENLELDDESIIQAMVTAPVLIQRPIVTVNGKAALGRPPEQVLEIL